MVKSQIPPGKGLGCLFLFALPFACVGVFMGYRTVLAVWEWRQMKSWVEVPAKLLSVELETHSGSDSTTYRVRARYRYSFEGGVYIGDRVAIHGGADNIGNFQMQRYRELSSLQKAQRSLRCYVDPIHPQRAVLYRDARWELIGLYLIFVVVFGGVGFGLMLGGVFAGRKLGRDDELRSRYPGMPWLQKEKWRTGTIASTSRSVLVTSTVFAVLWNAISAPLIFLVPREVGRGNRLALLGAIFPVVGAGLLCWAGRNVIRILKFGESVFAMHPLPGVVGGRLAGTVRTTRNLDPAQSFDLTLSAVRRTRRGSGDNRRTEETVLWQRSHSVSSVPSVNGPAIPVSFSLPGDLPPTDESNPDDQIVWRLSVQANVPGVDYESTFEVPVFRTEESSSATAFPQMQVDSPPWVREVDLEERLKKAGIRVEPLPSGRRYVFPPARCLKAAAFASFVFALWTGVTVLLLTSQVPRIFGGFSALFDVLFFFAVLDLWLYRSQVEVKEGGLSFRGGCFTLGKTRRWSAVEVAKIQPRRWMQWGTRAYYQLEVLTPWNKRQVVAKGFTDFEAAELLGKELARAIGKGG